MKEKHREIFEETILAQSREIRSLQKQVAFLKESLSAILKIQENYDAI